MSGAPLFITCARSVVRLNTTHRLATSSFPLTSARPILARAASTNTGGTDILLRNDDETNGIANLTLNNPKKYNVLSWDMLDTLQNQLDDIATNSSIRVVVVGATGKAFCSGHDLKEIKSHQNIEETTELFKKCSRLMISLNKLPQPIIAKVQGVATAAGCQLVASCDLSIGSSESRFGVSGINLGLFCSTPAVALSRVVQRKQAMHMLLTGELITAEKAESYGLLNMVVSPNLLESETSKLAEQIARKSSFGIRLGKQMFYKQLKYDSLEEAYDFATERVACNMEHSDARHGIDNFVNKKNKS